MDKETTDDLLIRLVVKTAKIEAMLSTLIQSQVILHTSAGAPQQEVLLTLWTKAAETFLRNVQEIASCHPTIGERLVQAVPKELEKL